MIDWKLDPDNQKKYDNLVARNRQLQAVVGIQSKTIAERAADNLKRQKEKEALEQFMGKRRPPPKWKL